MAGYIPDVTNLNLNAENLRFDPLYTQWSGVRYVSGNTEVAFAGDTSGRVLEIECPWGNPDMAAATLERIRGSDYQPFSADNALIDPAAEPGDTALISGAACPVVSMNATFDGLFTADISAPGEEALNRDYPIPTAAEIEQETEETVEKLVDNVEKVQDDIDGLEDDMDRIQDDIDGLEDDVGQITNIFGDTTILGPITTEALFAQYGDFVDLLVDRLSTSKRIKKYLAGDTSDDQHIKIEGEQILHIAGIHTGGTEQAVNPFGQPLFWKSNPDPDGTGIMTGSDGYPVVTDEAGKSVPVYTTTDPTDWPVTVYSYIDQIKASFSFELEKTLDDGTPVYTPTQILGAGNEAGTNQARILKGTDGLEIMYKPNNHSDGTPRDEIGIKMTTNGELEIIGYDFVKKIASEDDLPDDWASQNRIFVIEEE